MLTIVTYKWRPLPGYRSTFLSEHVNVLRNMIERHYSGEWRLVCVTDDPAGLDERITAIPLWDDLSDIPNPSAPELGPSCFRRLKMFARDAEKWLGKRILSLDLDCVITGDLTTLVERKEDFVIWGDTNRTTLYNGSMVLFTSGARPQLWEKFDRVESIRLARRLGYFGSDQAWISACLGRGEARFRRPDGVYSFRNEIMRNGGELPRDARIVFMHGAVDPWSADAQRLPWVRQHWR
jgi:hypothetical protein